MLWKGVIRNKSKDTRVKVLVLAVDFRVRYIINQLQAINKIGYLSYTEVRGIVYWNFQMKTRF